MTTAHVLPVLVAFGSRRVAAWERVRRRVGVAVGPLVLLLWAGLIATVAWFVACGARPPDRSGMD
jgi:hypothetical protein